MSYVVTVTAKNTPTNIHVTGTSTPYIVNIKASNSSDSISGGGTVNYIPVFASDKILKDSQITDDGQNIEVGKVGNSSEITLQGLVYLPIVNPAVGQFTPLAIDSNGLLVEASPIASGYPFLKRYPTLDIVGEAVAGLLVGTDKQSATFLFQCFGGNGFQYIVYHARNELGTWVLQKSIDEGSNSFDVVASTNGSAITFTFKARVTPQNYTPSVYVSAFGDNLDTSYAPTP